MRIWMQVFSVISSVLCICDDSGTTRDYEYRSLSVDCAVNSSDQFWNELTLKTTEQRDVVSGHYSLSVKSSIC